MSSQSQLLPDNADLYELQVRGIERYAMFLTDPAGRILTWNQGVLELFGYPEDEFIGQHATVIFVPEDRAAGVPETEMQRAREEGQAANIRWHVRKDGSRLYTHGTLQALRNDQGELLGYAKVVSDETKQKQLEDSLTQSNEALSQFAHAVAHDLQEPVRTIRSFVTLLERRLAATLEQDTQELMSFVVQGTGRIQHLIQDLLAYSELAIEQEGGDSVSLNEDVDTACTQLQQAIEESGITVTHDPLPSVRANRGQMVRLFQNLLSNAIKYRKPQEAQQVHVSAQREGSHWVISVRDHGIGFDPKFADQIFGLFKRLHQDEYAGTGLGLAMCKRVVERHGGRIWAESTPGEGAVFYFTVPALLERPSE